jgi:RNA polymerase sigma-70 factor (ECF subfamily)
MQRYANGEDGVFEELYRLMAPRLYRFCLRLATRQPEADDAFQETLLSIHRARATYLEGANTLHWAFAIARSVYLDRLRYRRRRPEDLGSANDAAEQERLHADDRYSPEAAVRAQDLLGVLARELSRMSEQNRSHTSYSRRKDSASGRPPQTRNDCAGGASAHPSCLRAAEDGLGRSRMEGE